MRFHPFESITEEQWKSGVSRQRCAECSEDYGHPVHCASSRPLVIVIEDHYVPEIAAPLLSGLQGLDEESGRVTIRLYTIDADTDLYSRRN